jgi:hypothetical protein
MSMMRATEFLEAPWDENGSKPVVRVRRQSAILIVSLISSTPPFDQVGMDIAE